MKARDVVLAAASCMLLSVPVALVATAGQETSGGVNPAGEAIASDPAVRQGWEDGGLTFTGAPTAGPAGAGTSGAGGRNRAQNKMWRITVYDYAQTTVLFTTTIGAGGDPPVRAAKAITRAIALLEQRTMTDAETRLSLGSTVLVRVRSHA